MEIKVNQTIKSNETKKGGEIYQIYMRKNN